MAFAARCRSGPELVGGREQAQVAVRSFRVTLPRRRNRTPAVLVLALLAGLVAMHGLSGTALAGPTHHVMSVAVLSMDLAGRHAAHGALPAAPAPDSPHHWPAASGHHPCVAALADAAALAAPADTKAAALPLPRHATGSSPARARADRALPT